ncbi:restriction endonuclease [Nocardioides sp. NPDC127503]|uniref:restriction endonuclease n=1 Tax=Nocardioides sp. NPDC127503 TaxID=3154516 RepID=UPI003318E72E
MTSGRVAWSRYEGNDVESVIAMMLNREHPNSVRITPSKGDGGIDILDRGAGPSGGDVVYQVKRYSGPVSASQKGKIKKSLDRIFDPEKLDPRWKDLKVTEWRLVMPWDPTAEAYQWLRDLDTPNDVTVVWDGLTFVDQLAAKFPDVIDYYLHEGRSAVEAAYQHAMALMSFEAGPLNDSVNSVVDKVRSALKLLDHDPHYLYDLRTGRGEPTRLYTFPGLVFSTYTVDVGAGTWHAIDVSARCAESTKQRPITFTGHLQAEPGSKTAEKMKDFIEYGAPFGAPTGVLSGVLDAPGGLGGEVRDAAVKVWSHHPLETPNDDGLHIDVVSPLGAVLATVGVRRLDVTQGTTGVRVLLEEDNGVFSIEMPADPKTGNSVWTFTTNPPTGKPVGAVLPAVKFLASYCAPNSFRVRRRHGPAGKAPLEPLRPAGELANRSQVMQDVLRLLASIQEHAGEIVTVPDVAELEKQLRGWRFAAAVLTGAEVTETLPEDRVAIVVVDSGIVPIGSFALTVPLDVPVGDQIIHCGPMFVTFDEPVVLEQATDADGRTVLKLRPADGKVRYSQDPG